MRIGVDVGGTNTDAVLMDGTVVVASAKQPTSPDVKGGVIAAIDAVLSDAGLSSANIAAVMIGTTQFTNALVERANLDEVGIIRLASPTGEALPPLTGWPGELSRQVGGSVFLLPGGFEVDGREISSLDEKRIRSACRTCRERGIRSLAVSSVFAPMNSSMEVRAAEIIREAYPESNVSLSFRVGRLGLVERENGVILNAALVSLARRVTESFETALSELNIRAPLYLTQNDGTLITAAQAACYPILTIGSGPTNSMRGAAFLTGLRDAIVMDVGGTTCDIGALSNGFPRESSVSVDIGGVRTNFRMPDILAIGLAGGTRIHIDLDKLDALSAADADFRVGPDSVGYRITQESLVFGGDTQTASDIAIAMGYTDFGDASLLSVLDTDVCTRIWKRMQCMLADGLDRVKTSRDDATIIAVGGGSFLVGDGLVGAADVMRPPHAGIANAVGAAIAQIGAHVERIVDYDSIPRDKALSALRQEAVSRVIASGGRPGSVDIVDVDEVFLSYLPGRSAQVRIKAVGDLAAIPAAPVRPEPEKLDDARHAY